MSHVALLWLNVAAYLSIWVMSLLRLALFRREFLDDLTEHKLGPGFFFYNEFLPEADHVEPGITQKVSSSDFHNWRKGFTPEELQKILNFYKDRYKQ